MLNIIFLVLACSVGFINAAQQDAKRGYDVQTAVLELNKAAQTFCTHDSQRLTTIHFIETSIAQLEQEKKRVINARSTPLDHIIHNCGNSLEKLAQLYQNPKAETITKVIIKQAMIALCAKKPEKNVIEFLLNSKNLEQAPFNELYDFPLYTQKEPNYEQLNLSINTGYQMMAKSIEYFEQVLKSTKYIQNATFGQLLIACIIKELRGFNAWFFRDLHGAKYNEFFINLLKDWCAQFGK